MHHHFATPNTTAPPRPDITIMASPEPTTTLTAQLQHIISNLEHQRTRVASLGLLHLGDDFFGDLADAKDLALLRQVNTVFDCLMGLSYLPGFSKPVDKAVNRLLLHAVLGCDQVRLHAQAQAYRPGDCVRWLGSREVEIQELLESYRGFFNYITFRESYIHLFRDPCLAEARLKLQKLRPRISTLSPWASEPEPFVRPAKKLRNRKSVPPKDMSTPSPTATKRRRKATQSGDRACRKRPRKQGPLPTPTPSHGMVLRRRTFRRDSTTSTTTSDSELTTTESSGFGAPTMILSRPTLRACMPAPAPPPNGAIFQDTTQDFRSTTEKICSKTAYPDTALIISISPSKQLKQEYAEWRERQMRPVLEMSPPATIQC